MAFHHADQFTAYVLTVLARSGCLSKLQPTLIHVPMMAGRLVEDIQLGLAWRGETLIYNTYSELGTYSTWILENIFNT